MKKLNIVAAIICLVFVSSLVLLPSVFSQTVNVKVLSYSYYVNSSGHFVIIGEVQNTGNFVLSSVTLNAVVYGTDGSQLASGTQMAYVSYLQPQQKAPFYIDFGSTGSGSSVLSNIGNVDLTISNAPPTNRTEYADLSLHVAFNGTLNDVYAVLGSVTNVGNQTATDIRVVGTYYNSAGTVIGVGFDILDGSLIPENGTVFSLSEFDATPTMLAQISSYSLLVQTATLQGGPEVSPTPTSTSPLDSSWLIYVAVAVVIVVVVGVVLIFLRKRRNLPLPPPPPPEQ